MASSLTVLSIVPSKYLACNLQPIHLLSFTSTLTRQYPGTPHQNRATRHVPSNRRRHCPQVPQAWQKCKSTIEICCWPSLRSLGQFLHVSSLVRSCHQVQHWKPGIGTLLLHTPVALQSFGHCRILKVLQCASRTRISPDRPIELLVRSSVKA